MPEGKTYKRSGLERLLAATAIGAALIMNTAIHEVALARGVFVAECIGADGTLKWRDEIRNTVVTVGKNAMLGWLDASAYSQVGPYLGLISSSGYSAISAADTMSSHAGWTEAGNANAPTYTAPRKTMVFAAASAGSRALSSALSYPITGTGTIKGGFVVLHTGAVSTIDNTSGTLFSAGLFTGGDRAVSNGDTVNVSWSLAL